MATAVFWFEALGLVALGVAILLSPVPCVGGPGTGACYTGESVVILDGDAAMTLLVLAGVGAVAVTLWAVTVGHRRLRGAACLLLGLAALPPVAWAAFNDLLLTILLVLWMGVPAVLMFGCASRLLTLRGGLPATAG